MAVKLEARAIDFIEGKDRAAHKHGAVREG